MNPPPPPAGSPHDADPAHLSASLCFRFAFFSVQFPTAFSMNFGFDPGTENPPKSHPGLKEGVPGGHRLRFFTRAGVSCVFRPTWRQKKTRKIDVFSVRVFDAARFFSNPATLDFADRLCTLESFQSL